MKEELERMLVDEPRLHDLMRDHMAWVSDCLRDGEHQGWTPMLAALVKASPADVKGELWMHALAVPFNEHEEKHHAMRAVGRRLYQEKRFPVAVVLSSECWRSHQRSGTIAPHCEPRHDPAREEMIQISGLTLDFKHAAMTFAPVERDDKENMKVGPFGPIVKLDGLPLLGSVFLGFMEETAKKAGIKLPGDEP